jgi:hypothetical protein
VRWKTPTSSPVAARRVVVHAREALALGVGQRNAGAVAGLNAIVTTAIASNRSRSSRRPFLICLQNATVAMMGGFIRACLLGLM